LTTKYKILLIVPFFLLLFASSLVVPAEPDVVVPYGWIVPGAYASYRGTYGLELFYPNHTEAIFQGEVDTLLKWTVVSRVADSVQLNITFFAEGNAALLYTASVPDGIVDIRDIFLVARAFGRKPYEVMFDLNADVTGPEGEPDQKIDIMDMWFIVKALGSSPSKPRYNVKADIAPEEKKHDVRHIAHHKTLLLDINVYTRETFLNEKPLGKSCFWLQPYANIGEKIVLYGLAPEEINGTVNRIDDNYMASMGWPGITVYMVGVFQLDPFARFGSAFDWHTGMATTIKLQGSQPKRTDLYAAFVFPNGTEYEIKRFAGAPIATELNIGFSHYDLFLNSTNVQIGPPS